MPQAGVYSCCTYVHKVIASSPVTPMSNSCAGTRMDLVHCATPSSRRSFSSRHSLIHDPLNTKMKDNMGATNLATTIYVGYCMLDPKMQHAASPKQNVLSLPIVIVLFIICHHS